MKLFEKKEPLEIIREKYDAYNKAIEDVNAAINGAREKVTEAREALELAAEQNDAAAFTEAKKKVADFETALEMATMRKECIVSKGPCPKEDVDGALNYYNQAHKALDKKTARELLALYEQIKAVCNNATNESRAISGKFNALCDIVGKKIDSNSMIATAKLRSVSCVVRGNVYPLRKPGEFGNGGLDTLYQMADQG